MTFFLNKNVSRPSNPPEELAQHVSKKNPRRTNYSSIFSVESSESDRVFNYLHDSNSIFRVGRIKSEIFKARTVSTDYGPSCNTTALSTRRAAEQTTSQTTLNLLFSFSRQVC